MAKNEFLPFATEAGSLLQPLTGYANDDRRKHGNQPGIADPAFCNRTWRQSSLMAAALGELIAELGIDALDQNDVSKLKNAIKGAMTLLQQKGLSDSVTSESSTTAASSKAVNTVFKAISSAFVANSAVDDWDKATTLGANYFIAGNLPHGPTPNDSKAMFIVLVLAYSTDRIMQVALPHNMAINIHVRVQYNDYTWGSWRAYGRTIDPAVSARKLTDPVNISLTGDAAGSVSFDGSSSVAINTTVNAAAKLKTPRTITLTGGATGSASFLSLIHI